VANSWVFLSPDLGSVRGQRIPGWGPVTELDWRPGRFDLAFRLLLLCALFGIKSMIPA
jgi:hypothetical protein